jgi:hypothetical protein
MRGRRVSAARLDGQLSLGKMRSCANAFEISDIQEDDPGPSNQSIRIQQCHIENRSMRFSM